MVEIYKIHSITPQPQRVLRVVQILGQGGIAIIPTDSYYALVCRIDKKSALKKICFAGGVPDSHLWSVLFYDLSQLSTYTQLSNVIFKYIRQHTPGPFTFILPGEMKMMRQVLSVPRDTIGARLPNHNITMAILAALRVPLTCIAINGGGDQAGLPQDFDHIDGQRIKQADVAVNAGTCIAQPTTIVDITQDAPVIVREGQGKFII